jgi:hypothetical protein
MNWRVKKKNAAIKIHSDMTRGTMGQGEELEDISDDDTHRMSIAA